MLRFSVLILLAIAKTFPWVRAFARLEFAGRSLAKAGLWFPPVPVSAGAGVFFCMIKVYQNQTARQCWGLDYRILFSYISAMEKKSTRGGKRPGAGRKPKLPEERRDQVFSVKLTADEKALLETADARSWARDALVRVAQRRVK
ncbi:MAG: hypothetical protein K8T91_24040 [Planctomycetes bacterium]|nr:hypothetical protein [Planctomycetota bacterium]